MYFTFSFSFLLTNSYSLFILLLVLNLFLLLLLLLLLFFFFSFFFLFSFTDWRLICLFRSLNLVSVPLRNYEVKLWLSKCVQLKCVSDKNVLERLVVSIINFSSECIDFLAQTSPEEPCIRHDLFMILREYGIWFQLTFRWWTGYKTSILYDRLYGNLLQLRQSV